MDFVRRHLFDLLGVPFTIWLQWSLYRRLVPVLPERWHYAASRAAAGAMALIGIAFLISLPGVGARLPYSPVIEWFKALGLAWSIGTAGAWAVDSLWRTARRLLARPVPTPVDTRRRQLLELGARAAAMAVPGAMLGYGALVERGHFRLVEQSIRVAGLPEDLNGLRLVQLTDLHFGPFFSARDLRYAIDMANSAKAQLALVTGDFISVHSDPLDECLQLLSALRAEAGVLGCLGNHEIVARCQDYTELRGAETGLRILRNTAAGLRFGKARLNVAGVDYQRKSAPYLAGAAALVKPGEFNLLLSHNPDVFPVAAGQGWDLTLAGHTHGGQIAVEILGVNANIARFYTPYVHGHYERDGRQIYVSRGLGTVGVPSRVGAPPEVSILTLCAT